MISRFRISRALFCLSLLILPTPGLAQDLQGWVQGLHSRVRLVSGDLVRGQWYAGIEIALDPGFKTYWRNPGESGLPPRFGWSDSENVKSAEVHWPAPARSEDATGVSHVYYGEVLLPVVVEAVDPARPVRLALNIEYGICKDICIPAQARLELILGTQPSRQAAIDAALRTRVPRAQALGANEAVSILAVEPDPADRAGFSVVLRTPAGTPPALFVEAPDGWYFSTSTPDERNRVTLTLDEKPKDATGPVTLRLTLVAGEKSVESIVRLDAPGEPR